MIPRKPYCLLLSICSAAFQASLREGLSDTITLRAVADTTLQESLPGNNMGASTTMLGGTRRRGGRNRGLVRFDLATNLPPGAVVTNATLTLVVTQTPSGAANSTFELRRVLQPWGEGGKAGQTGAPATDGEATWNSRLHPSMSWAAPGGSIGTDFSTTISSSKMIGGSTSHSFPSSADLISDIQHWQTNSSENFGWVFMSQAESTLTTIRRFGSLEGGTAVAPSLQVDFEPPPRIDRAERVGSQFRLHFRARPGQAYQVEQRSVLGAGGWNTLTNIPPSGVATDPVVSDPIGPGNRFYRLVIP